MKAILEFNLPEDEPEFRVAQDGGKWKSVAWDFDQWLRNVIKHTEEKPCPQDIRDKFYEILEDSGVTFDD